MAISAAKMTRNVIVDAKTRTPALTVSETSTSTNVYAFVAPMAEAGAVVAADAERVLFARSYLAAQGEHLDNVAKEINSVRLRNECDSSFRRNAPRMFSPDSPMDTLIDEDAVGEVNDQLTDIQAMSTDQLFALMKSKFFRIKGATDLPMMMPRVWKAVAFRLREMYDHICNVEYNLITEDSEDLGDTDWIYRMDALRVPGVRDVKVEISDYNEFIVHVYINERIMTDSRSRKSYADPAAVIADVGKLIAGHLPKPDRRTLKAPRVIVRQAQEKPVYIRALWDGTVEQQDVATTIEDYFYDTRRIGEAMTVDGITDAVMALSGVTAFTLSSPNIRDLIPSSYEILVPGTIHLINITDGGGEITFDVHVIVGGSDITFDYHVIVGGSD